MIRPSSDSEIYLYRHAVDMRKGANGLVTIVEAEMNLDPFSSKLFVPQGQASRFFVITLAPLLNWWLGMAMDLFYW